MNLSINTDVFIVIIAHEIGFRAFAYPARRRTVSQLGIVSITCKPKSQLPHLVSITMDGSNMMELEQEFAQALQRTAKKIAETEGCSYQEGLVRIVNVLANLKVQ